MVSLTEKELLAIEDQLNLEELLVIKYQFYAELCSDPQLKAQCQQLAAKHQAHYDSLLNCLE